MANLRKIALFGLLACLCVVPAFGTVVPTDVPNVDPEVELRSFKIDPNFEIHLWAADPMIEKPIQMNWDGHGRLWCAASETYPQLVPGKTPNDKVIVLEDTTGSGKADKSTVFADGLFLPTAVVPGDGGAYVTNSTEILHLRDTKGTGKADERRVVLAGFGAEDTHHIVHTLRWGPDGKLYFLQSIYIHSHLETPRGLKTLLGSGAWRYDTRTLDLGVYSRGLVNPWGLLWDRWGNTFETDGAGGEGINYAFPGIGFTSAVGYDRIMPGLNPGSPKYASEEILDSTTIPDDYQGDILTNDFRANRIVRFKVSDNGAGFTSKQMPDFLTSTDVAFRPVDIKMGPDGAIYIADWYNPIIQHGEVDFRDARRDHLHGRIWRVTVKGQSPLPRPQIDGASIPQLLEFLKSPEDWTRAQAKLALRERDPKEVLPALKAWVDGIHGKTAQADHDRLEALWTCENLDSVEPDLLERVMHSRDARARAAAARVAGHWAGQLSDPIKLLEPLVTDEAPRVRLEAIRALAQVPSPQAVVVATEALDKPIDPFIDYALWLTCTELQPLWMPAYESGKLAGWQPDHQNFALRAVGSPAALKAVVDQIKSDKTPAAVRRDLIDRIARTGGQPEADALFGLAIDNPMRDPGTQAELLSALLAMTKAKEAKPSPHPERLDALANATDESVKAAALRLAGAWRRAAFRPELLKIAASPDASDATRAAAMDGLALMGDRASVGELRKLAAPPTETKIRRQAIASLAQVDLRNAVADATALLTSGDTDPAIFLSAFLTRDGGPQALAAALKGMPIPADTAKLALRYLRGTTSQDQSLTETFSNAAGISGMPIKLSPEQMKQTIAEVMARGDAARGERVFRRTDASCYLCHSIDGAGGWLAPDLSSIGASSPVDYLINSVLDPNKDIKDGFDGLTVVTQSGDVYSGIKVGQDNTRLILRDNAHLEIPIPLADIKAQKSIGSLMPNGLADTLTHPEFLDLIRFLSELGKPGPYASTPAQYIRRWRVVDPVPPDLASSDEGPSSAAAIASLNGKDFPPAYSLVSGVLPLDALAPNAAPTGVVRAEVNVTAPGPIRLILNDPQGVSLWADDKPVAVSGPQLPLTLPRGLHTLTFRVTTKGRPDGLRVEVTNAPNSSAQAQPIGGK
ncbi:MAG TPA: PVC-type heme-binding CxxCH protein [Tepidisphaeraceae bacterium]|jgi:putative heme-binding domain-containing protein